MFQLDSIMSNLPIDAEIINIGLHQYSNYSHSTPWDLSSSNTMSACDANKNAVNEYICYYRIGINPSSLAYIVTLSGALNLFSYVNSHGFSRATDFNYNNYLKRKNIFYGAKTVLCTGDPGLGSDVFGVK